PPRRRAGGRGGHRSAGAGTPPARGAGRGCLSSCSRPDGRHGPARRRGGTPGGGTLGVMLDLHTTVADWYARHARDLPWRRPGTTPWGVRGREVMSQQTPVARVAPVWEQWMARWPRPGDLAAATPADVLRAWHRLGYPRRALRLRECAVAVVERFAGEVPATEE